MSVQFKNARDQFDAKFDSVFVQTNSNQEARSLTDNEWTVDQLDTCKYALSNMLGSITYMHGNRMVFQDGKVVSLPDAELFTGVPDRPDHARGFMWDEGFHNHLISIWNLDLTEEIISSWFASTDDNGWICREQMLGQEIRSGAPPSSWPQIESNANPPSQHLLLFNLLDRFNDPNY